MVTIHHGTSFVVADEIGDIAAASERGYFHLDTRFLSRHEVRLDGKRPIALESFVPHAGESWHFLTNPPLDGAGRSTLGMTVHRQLGGGLRERIELENFGGAEAQFALSVGVGSDFAYILTVKQRAAGGDDGWRPSVRASVHGDREVRFELDEGSDPHRLAVTFDPAPTRLGADGARFDLRLARRQRWSVVVELAPALGGRWVRPAPPSAQREREVLDRRRALGRAMPTLETDHPVLARAFDQASRDVAALRIKADGSAGEDGGGGEYAIAAGIPWYMDLFGRDSLLSSYEAILHDPPLARGTLDALAALQGRKVDRVSEEAPGKILHEYRRGPLTPAARKLIPTYPYYGTIDATPLFLVTLSEYVRTTGDLEFARRAWPHVEAAVAWMRDHGDRDGDGLLEYQRDGDVGLVNQCWKDSADSMRFRDGRIADAPIAVVEAQGYAYDARRRMADLARRLGHGDAAERLEEEAAALRRRIADRYWMDDRAYFAEALDGRKRQVDALTSNPGHLLWSGAVDRQAARAVARVLLGPDLFTGYGVRTMGEREGGFNPVSYHNGSVWPHDNAILLAGLVRYGLHEEASRLATGLLSALARFPDAQPPELFCGYAADRYGTPVPYPTACRPQAWASGAVLLLTRALLGIEVDALARQVSLAPTPVPGLSRLVLRRVPLGGTHVDVSMRVDGREARAEISGLPAGWRRVDPEPAGR